MLNSSLRAQLVELPMPVGSILGAIRPVAVVASKLCSVRLGSPNVGKVDHTAPSVAGFGKLVAATDGTGWVKSGGGRIGIWNCKLVWGVGSELGSCDE